MPAVPDVFSAANSYGNAVNQDGTLNTPQNPAPLGSVISLFLSGLGPLDPAEPDGAITPWPAPALAYSVQVWFPYPDHHVFFPGKAEMIYAGPAPLALSGLYQINVKTPDASSIYAKVPSLYITVTLPDGRVVYGPSVPIALAP